MTGLAAPPGGSTIPAMAATAPSRGLYGREAEISQLSQALDRAASGHLAVVLIEGEPGIGKTRLLAGTLGAARGRGLQAATACAEELERSQAVRRDRRGAGLRAVQR